VPPVCSEFLQVAVEVLAVVLDRHTVAGDGADYDQPIAAGIPV
jgi:hypothetical protein